jgi:hypothetical protein
MRALPGVLMMTLILVAAIGGCASSGPSSVHVKEGTALAGYEEDEKYCKEVGWQALKNYGKGATQPTAASTYSDPKYGTAPAIAADGATSFMSGLERGKAKGAAYKAAYDECFAQKGYRRVPLTEAEQGAYKSLSSDAQREQMGRWVSGKERPATAQ